MLVFGFVSLKIPEKGKKVELQEMFPMIDVIVMVHGRQEARASGNFTDEKEDTISWSASRNGDPDKRLAILYALANAGVAQLMTEEDLGEWYEIIQTSYALIHDTYPF